MKIDILTPTRQRVNRVFNFLNSIKKTVSDVKNVAIYFYIDDDDEISINNIKNIKDNFKDLEIHFKIGPRIILSNCWNELWKISKNEIIMLSNDDIIFATKNWDETIIEEFEKCSDKILLIFGKDGISNENISTFPFISRKSTNILGYFCPPYFSWGYNDLWFDVVYYVLQRRKYLSNISINHQSFRKFPSKIDETYIENLKFKDEATAIWYTKRDNRIIDVLKLTEYLDDKLLKIKIKLKIFLYRSLYFSKKRIENKFTKISFILKNSKFYILYLKLKKRAVGRIKKILFRGHFH
ncbi:MAG: hypothetical protein ACTSRG_26440 [Candidatus Helarchaeota archaeon]